MFNKLKKFILDCDMYTNEKNIIWKKMMMIVLKIILSLLKIIILIYYLIINSHINFNIGYFIYFCIVKVKHNKIPNKSKLGVKFMINIINL